MSYDKTYNNTENVFGSKPEKILTQYANKINKTHPVLDIGIGQGRNAFYLAQKGIKVDGLDSSKVAIEQVAKIAKDKNYPIDCFHESILQFTPQQIPYSAILNFGLLQILEWKSIHSLIKKIDLWTEKGSLLFITAFSTLDTNFTKHKQQWTPIGKNSFSNPNDEIRTYFEPNEILSLFSNYKTLYHWEGKGPIHRHGDSPEEQHAMIEFVGIKNANSL